MLINRSHQRFLKILIGEYYKLVFMPSGYGPAMRVFTKTEATIYIPKKKVQLSVAHVDDGYLQGKTMGMVLV